MARWTWGGGGGVWGALRVISSSHLKASSQGKSLLFLPPSWPLSLSPAGMWDTFLTSNLSGPHVPSLCPCPLPVPRPGWAQMEPCREGTTPPHICPRPYLWPKALGKESGAKAINSGRAWGGREPPIEPHMKGPQSAGHCQSLGKQSNQGDT